MAEHAVCFEALANRSNAGLGLPLSYVTTVEANGIAVAGAAADYQTAALPTPLVPPSAYGPTASVADASNTFIAVAKAIGMVQDGGVAPPVPAGAHAGVFTARASGAEYYWNINGVAASNGAAAPLVPLYSSGLAGRITRDQSLRWANDAGTALEAAAADPVLFHGHLEYRYPLANPYQGLAHFLEFADVPPNAAVEDLLFPTMTERLDSLLRQLVTQSGSRYLLGNSGGVDFYAEECAFAAVAPEGAVYIRPEDFGGVAADRIPNDYQQNEAARFRFHPSVFIRRPQYLRGLIAPYADWYAIDALDTYDQQVMRVVTVEADPSYSTWLLIIDGQAEVVRLDHPAGSDLRRPRDIWNEVWAPLIAGSNAVAAAVQIGRPIPGGAAGVVGTTFGLTNRLRFLEYARCLPINGTRQDQGQPN